MKPLFIQLFLSVFLISPAFANKPLPKYEAAEVGETLGILVKPQIGEDSWSQLESSEGRVWTRTVEKEGAQFLKLHFKDFNLRAGDKLIIKSDSGRVVETLTGFGPKNMRTFWALSVFGERAHLELHYNKPYKEAPFEIDRVVVGDINFEKENKMLFSESLHAAQPMSICGNPDFEDVKCHEANQSLWKNVVASVGVMTAGGSAGSSLFCSGSNVSPNNYVLTNAHCIRTQGDCDKAEFVFRYYKTGCGGTGRTTSEWVSYRCEEVVKMSPFGDCEPDENNLDFSLNKVSGDPASQFGYVQIDTNPVKSGDGIYIVQHPSGRPREITMGSGRMVAVEGRTLRYYDALDTEPGSSGSPIFREDNHKLIGLHHCGGCATSGVGNRGMRMDDIYPLIQDYICQPGRSVKIGLSGDAFEVKGNGDSVMDQGETWGVTPKMTNSSCDTATGRVTVEFDESTGSRAIKMVNSRVEFGSAEPGKSQEAPEAVEFVIQKVADCGVDFEIKTTSVRSSGGRIPYDHNTVYAGKIGSVSLKTVASEDFSNGLPEGWSISDQGTGTGEFETWKIQNDGTRKISLTEPFFIVDSDYHKDGRMDESLITKSYDMSEFSSAQLQFAHVFKFYENEFADVEIRSNKTSNRWVRLASYHRKDKSGTETFDITEYAAGARNVQVRFRYFDAEYDWYWAIDDVYIIGGGSYTCEEYSDK